MITPDLLLAFGLLCYMPLTFFAIHWPGHAYLQRHYDKIMTVTAFMALVGMLVIVASMGLRIVPYLI